MRVCYLLVVLPLLAAVAASGPEQALEHVEEVITDVPLVLDKLGDVERDLPSRLEETARAIAASTSEQTTQGAPGDGKTVVPSGDARNDVFDKEGGGRSGAAGHVDGANTSERKNSEAAPKESTEEAEATESAPRESSTGFQVETTTDAAAFYPSRELQDSLDVKPTVGAADATASADTSTGVVPEETTTPGANTEGATDSVHRVNATDVPHSSDETTLKVPPAFQEARQALQETLDQVLQEAAQWAQHAHHEPGDDEYYDDDNLAADPEVIENARADVQRTLEQMLNDAQRQALEGAAVEEGEEEEARDDAGPSPPHSVSHAQAVSVQAGDQNEMDQGSNLEVPRLPPTDIEIGAKTERKKAQTSAASTTATSPTETTSTTPEISSTPSTGIMSSPTPFSATEAEPTVEWTTEENLWSHLVMPLEEVGMPAAEVQPGAATILQGDNDTHQVAVNEDVVEGAVAAAAAVHADREMLRSRPSLCPTKQCAPLRLPALQNAALESDNPQCARDSRLLDLHVRNHTLWAVQMQDAGAAGITGLLEGNVYHLGDFDECMDVKGPMPSQYCVAEIRVHTPPRTHAYRHHPDFPPDPMQSVWNRIKHEGEAWRLPLDTIHMAFCAPASCGTRDLQDSIQRQLDECSSRLPVRYTVTVSDALCTSSAEQSPPLSQGEIAYIILVTALVLAVFSGTLIDFFATKKKGCIRWPLLLFSLKRNWHMLTKSDPRPMGLDLDPLSGARTVNMMVLLIAHRGFNVLRGPVHNYNQYESMPRTLLQTGATHAQLFVDTCFVLSGLLVSLLELTRAHAHGKNSDARAPLMAALVHRYVRLTPSYAMVVFFYATLFWRMGSGPLWDQVIGHEREACANYWWTNLFYVNNYINTEKLCMFQSWYLPCDLHLFFIGSALTLLISRHRRTGLGFLLVILTVSMVVPFFVTLLGSKPALLEMLPTLFRAPDQSENFRTVYAPTHMRAAPYMVGLLAGYLFQRLALRHRERFPQGVTWLLCLGGVALTTASLLSSVVFYNPDTPYNGVTAGLYAALCPVVWSLGVCLVLASLVLGTTTVMSTILSWKPLVVLSRLTYNVYLTHWAFQMASVAKARVPFHLDPYNLIFLSFGDMVASFLTSLVLFFLVEAPFRSLARKLTEPPPESKVHIQAAQKRAEASVLEAGLPSKHHP